MGLVPYNSATIPLFCATPIIYQYVNNPSKYMCGSKCFLIFGYYRMTKTKYKVSSTPLHKRESYLQTLVVMGVSE